MIALAKAMRPLEQRIRLMLGRGVISGVNDGALVQELQLDLLADESQDGVEHFQQYGLTASPPVGLEALVGFVGGLRSHGVVLAVGDRQYRLRGLESGEVALYDDQGQAVHLTRDGIRIVGKKLTVESEGAIEFTAASIKATADSIELATDNLKLGNGAVLAAARKTDAVADGAISAGSSKVKVA